MGLRGSTEPIRTRPRACAKYPPPRARPTCVKRPRGDPKNNRSPNSASSPRGRGIEARNWSWASRGRTTPCSINNSWTSAEQSRPTGVRPPQRYGTPSSERVRSIKLLEGVVPITTAPAAMKPRRPSGSSANRCPDRTGPAIRRPFQTTGLTNAPDPRPVRTSAYARTTRPRARSRHLFARAAVHGTIPQLRTHPS